MPASGMPVASTITSMPGCAISASRIGGDMRGALLQRVAERRRRELLGRPAGGRKLASRALDVEIGDRDDMQAARQPRLRQEHGAELAGADQADGDGPGFAFEEERAGSCGIDRFRAQRSTKCGRPGLRLRCPDACTSLTLHCPRAAPPASSARRPPAPWPPARRAPCARCWCRAPATRSCRRRGGGSCPRGPCRSRSRSSAARPECA